MNVREIMTSSVEDCRPSTDLAAAAAIMWRNDCGVVPVVDDGLRVAGVITDRDICMAAATRHRRPEELTAGQVMSGRVHTVRPDADVRDALELMRAHRVRRLPVTDDQGVLCGMLSITDVIRRTTSGRRRATGEPTGEEVVQAMRLIAGQPAGTSALTVG